MNPALILSLICDLYAQVGRLENELKEKQARLDELEESSSPDSSAPPSAP